jgi:hypothetical protein
MINITFMFVSHISSRLSHIFICPSVDVVIKHLCVYSIKLSDVMV